MVRLYVAGFFAMFMLVVPKESVGQNGQLAELNEIKIVVEYLRSETKRLGLKRLAIKDHVLVLLRSKLPRLSVKDSAIPYIYINVKLGIGLRAEIDYFGSVTVAVKRGVIIVETGEAIAAGVWNKGRALTGPKKSAVNNVREALNSLLTAFAADWYRDNPTK